MGRPPVFSTPEQMQDAVDAYFNDCKENDIPYTICGLALAIGMTRETLRCYGNNERFSDIVKRAKLIVEESVERRLFGSSPTGAIFHLKANSGWRDSEPPSEEETTPQKVQIEIVDARTRD
jgi:hypothetical protein